MKTLKKIITLFLFFIAMLKHVSSGPATDFLFGSGSTEQFGATLEPLSTQLMQQAPKLFADHQLFLFDGSDGANQCHINALMVMLIAQGIPILDRASIIRFLALNLFLSSRTEGNSRPEKLAAILELPITGKLKNAIKSGQSKLILHAKQELLTLKEQFFNEHLSPLVEEKTWGTLAFDQNNRAIFPKFIGIWCHLKKLKQLNNTWTIIKCHLPDTSRVLFFISPDQQTMTPEEPTLPADTPVIVIEGETTNADTLSLLHPEQLQLANAAAWMHRNQPSAALALLPELLREDHRRAFALAQQCNIGPNIENAMEDSDAVFSIHHMSPSTMERELA